MGGSETGGFSTGAPLVRRIFFGALWQGASLFFQSGLRFITKLLLAYLLVPEDFGLVGMAVVFTGVITTISEAGIGSALIQRRDEDLTDSGRYSAHLAAIVLSTLVYLLILLPGAYPMAWFFGEPRLVPIIMALGLPVVIRSFATWEYAFIRRDLRFKEWATIEGLSALLSSVFAIILAIVGFGVWSIVAQSLLYALFLTFILKSRYEAPQKAPFSWEELKSFIPYSAFVTGNQALKFVTEKLDYLVVGRIVGATQLGLYTLAFMLTETIRDQITSALSQVLFPVYSKVQDDREQVNRFYLSAIKFNALLVFPLVSFFLVYPQEFVVLLFGEQWSHASAPLFYMAIASMIFTIGGTSRSLLRAIGYPQIQFRIQSIKIIFVTLPAITAGTYFFGLVGATWAVILDKAVERIWYQYYMRHYVGTTELQIAGAVAVPMVGFLVMTAFLEGLRYFYIPQNLGPLLGVGCVGGLLYLAVTLPLLFEELKGLIQTIRQR